MDAKMSISERDVRKMLDLVHLSVEADPGEPLPWPLLGGLKELVGAESLEFCQFDVRAGVDLMSQEVTDWDTTDATLADADPAQSELFRKHYFDSVSCCYPEVSGDLGTVTTASDFHSDRQLRSTPMWTDCVSRFGGFREMMLCLPSRPERALRLLFWRGPGRDFDDRDRAVMTLLRPHIFGLYQGRRRRGTALTPRQTELLKLVAAGCTNHQIATRLSVSEATVRKHLEHIFERLQVTSRTEAVTQAFGLGEALDPPA